MIDTAFSLALIYILSVIFYLVFAAWLSVSAITTALASAALLLLFVLLPLGLAAHDHDRFGYANLVTAIRAALTILVIAVLLIGQIPNANGTALQIILAIILTALALDGVDGWLARRFRQTSAFGARFDMEIDALMILTLSAAALLLGKTGFWVLLIGLMRYIFVIGQSIAPFMRRPLPPSFTRKLICVVQIAALCVILLPSVMPPVSSLIAGLSLLLLVFSFSRDTAYLLAHRHDDDGMPVHQD
ncbi:CDP-alcohol phosphatidyltransferase family protein [Martelella sp. HB161492]|uniref:CDP-alcohol phosphatidyltransferase family protein n=1 Tax=Martelella sp. HB161492 TaxID=2720726 RepID=UPI0015923754|nr:CDP-alcohol phosphatidyltransferase family protein [Martelella sp. HB161492]